MEYVLMARDTPYVMNSVKKYYQNIFYKRDNLNVYLGAKHKLLHKEILLNFYIDIHNIYMKNLKQPLNNVTHMLNQSLWLNWKLKNR